MFIRTTKGIYHEIVKSVKIDGKVKTQVLHYLGRLSPSELKQVEFLIGTDANLKSEDELKQAVYQFLRQRKKSPQVTQEKPPPLVSSSSNKVRILSSKNEIQDVVTLQLVRPQVYKKIINPSWLKKMYLDEGLSIGSIAQLSGTSKDRVREHLTQMGISTTNRQQFAKERTQHAEFGWKFINGIKSKDPREFRIIELMIKWKNSENLSYQIIANKLTQMKISGKLGCKTWDRGAVRRIIMRNLDEIEN
jgi:hypothetical protein